MLNMLFLEFSALVALRILAFLGCRKYLLRSLYSDLQTLSLDTTDPLTPDLPQSPSPSESGIQLDSLPAPATQTKVTKMLPNDSSYLHSTVSRSVFSLVFAESCMMFFVLMLQGIDVFLPRTRLLSWQFSLIFLMVIILVIVPLSISVLLAVGSKPSGMTTTRPHHLLGPRVCLGLLSVVLYLFALSKIPLPHALSSTDTFTAALSRLIVLGTFLLGLLSGYGAISNSWAFIPWVSPDRGEPTDQDVATAEYALQSIRNDLNERTAAAERRSALPTTEGSNWFSRVVPNFRGSGDGSSSELQGLQALEYQMSRKLEALRARRDAARYARTLRGRILGIGARVFAFYCVFRIISSIINLITPSRRPTSPSAQPSGPSYPDLLADLLALVSPYPLNFDDVVSFSRQLSLALVGLIILTSVRRVLLGVTRALRVTSRNLGASLMMLILAQLMGIYLLSTIVQLRNSFPPPPHSPSSGETPNLFSTIPAFEVFGALFDWSFVLAAAASAFVRWGHERVNGVEDV